MDNRAATAAPDALASLTSAFSDQIALLQQAAALRCADLAPHASDLSELEASVQALEDSLQQIQTAVACERAQLPKARALAEAFRQQTEELQFMAEHLPPHLPAATAAPAHPAAQPDKENERPQPAVQPPAQPGSAPAAAAKRARPPAPRRYITVQELDSVPSYMRSRLTLEKVNAAVGDVAALSEANAKLVAAAKGRGTGLSVEDRRHAQSLVRNVVTHEGVKGSYWILERDCKHGSVVRMDKTGKAILTILRHLGRLSELHVQMDEDKFENVYILL